MRVIVTMITLFSILICTVSFAQSPQFRRVTIKGKTTADYNKVCLFEKGSAKKPFKTEQISEYSGMYNINIAIPSDMKKKDDYYYTDIRFWGDKNDNGIRDPGEPISQCHFIIWVPSANIVYMQVYKGEKYPFESSTLKYNYK